MAKQIAFDINENIIETPLEQALPASMMIYSEHVILERAIPRVEDGLKPVQRRILYTLYTLGMKPNTPYKKSARVVGECLGKYHPHGDSSVYEAMVRMAQDFSVRMPLVDGHGNFGSIDGDPAAAMRYTEVRMQPIALELLRDIDKNTVRMNKNFDDTLDEPDVLPGRFPNILVNGASGIAIGLATEIPSHNLTEVIDGCIALIDEPRMKLPELLQIIKGPDFPTGGFLVAGEDMLNAYETGRGKFVLRGKVEIENTDRDTQNIVITELPYGVNKVTITERIYSLKDTKKEIFGGIVEVTDESDRNGMRVVIRLKKGEDAVKILNELYAKTDLQCNYNMNMVAVAAGKPKLFGLIPMLKYYLDYQKQVIVKRTQYDLSAAKKREHIVDGYVIIMPNIDEVIAIIKNAPTRAEAKVGLRERFELSDAQAEAILTLQLGSINKLDVKKFENELAELRKQIAKYNKILSSSKEQYAVVRSELEEIRDKYKSKRRTTIIGSLEEVDVKPFDPTKRTAKRCVVTIDTEGAIKLISSRSYLAANRDAEANGLAGLVTNIAQVEPEHLAIVFGSEGNAYRLNTNAIKDKLWKEVGEKLVTLFPATEAKKEKAVFTLSFAPDEVGDKEVFIYTEQGMIKRTLLKNYIVSKDIYQVMKLADGDHVIGGEIVDPNSTVYFVTSDGQCVNAMTDEVPLQGRIAGGVIGINVNDGAKVVYAGQSFTERSIDENGNEVYLPIGEIALITNKGVGKKVIVGEFSPMKRGRKGLRIIDIYNTNAHVAFATMSIDSYNIAVIDSEYEISVIDSESIYEEKKDTKGKPIIRGKKIVKIVRHFEEI